jgi:hypothetical protein
MTCPSRARPPGPSGNGCDPRLAVGMLDVPPSTASRPPRKPRGGTLRGWGVGRVRGPGRFRSLRFEREGVSGSSEMRPVRFAGRSRFRPGTGLRSGWSRGGDSSPRPCRTEPPQAETTILTWVGSPREQRAPRWLKRWRVATDSSMDQGLEVGGVATDRGPPFLREGGAAAPGPPDGERASAAVTRHGCRRGESSEGWTRHGNGGARHIARWFIAVRASSGRFFAKRVRERRAGQSPETWRTPWSAAGCNKPARYRAE